MDKSEEILSALLGFQQATQDHFVRLEGRMTAMERRMSAMETRFGHFETKVMLRFDQIDRRLVAVEHR